MIGSQTGSRVGPKGDPGYPGSPGLKGERGPQGKCSQMITKHLDNFLPMNHFPPFSSLVF